MKKRRLLFFTVLMIFAGTACVSSKNAAHREVPRITKDELRANLDNKEYVVIDVRIPKDYGNSNVKIKGAIRENPMDVNFWSPYPKDKKIVLYCA